MTEHPTLESAALDHTATPAQRAGEPANNAASVFTDLVCADNELLHAEFDAIITANFPDPADHPQRRDPTVPIRIGTVGRPPCRGAAPSTTGR